MPQVTLPNYNPPIEGARSAFVYSPTALIDGALAVVGATEVAIVVEDTLTLRRQNEIVSALRFLQNGIRDRNLLDDQFKGFALYTTVPLDRITSSARLTASDNTAVGFGTGVLAIAMGATATDKQHVGPLDTAIDQMIDILLENIKDQAA